MRGHERSEGERHVLRTEIEKFAARATVRPDGKRYISTIQYINGRHFTGEGTTEDAVRESLRSQMWGYECRGRRY